MQVRKQHQIDISKRFAAFENLNYRGWENTKGSIKTSFKEDLGMYELKQHKPWFD